MTYFTKYTNNNIFKNIKYLDPDCIPIEFHHREHEMATLASYISPVYYGGIPNHAIIIGDNATGKTTAIRKLFQEITETLPEGIPVYINCRKHNTEYKIMTQIYQHVTKQKAPQRGSNTNKLYEQSMKQLQKNNQHLLIALDDVNYLLGTEELASPNGQNIIHKLTRANESYHAIIGIYPIITNQEFKYQFDREVNTLFMPREVHFKHYTKEQYYQIIKERCEYAFTIPINDKVITRIVDEVTKTHNIRYAWDILKEFGIKYSSEPDKKQNEIINEIL